MNTARRPLQAPPRPKALLQSAPSSWYRISNKTDSADTTVIDIYDEIGESLFFGGGVGAEAFNKDLRAITTPNIEVHINSPGGDVWDGVAIYNGLLQHPANVHVIVDSLAASAASFIAMAGDEVSMMRNATMMIHDASGLTIGNAADHEEMVGLLNQLSNNIASIYSERAGGDVADWRNHMKAETWYTAQEAVDAGLADNMLGREGKPANARWNSRLNQTGESGEPADDVETQPVEEPDPVPETQVAEEAADGRKLSDMLARADALIAGRDPEEKADDMQTARLAGQLAARADLDEVTARLEEARLATKRAYSDALEKQRAADKAVQDAGSRLAEIPR